jgi:hypothetical protein
MINIIKLRLPAEELIIFKIFLAFFISASPRIQIDMMNDYTQTVV